MAHLGNTGDSPQDGQHGLLASGESNGVSKGDPAILDPSTQEHVGILNSGRTQGIVNDSVDNVVVVNESKCQCFLNIILMARLEIFLGLYLLARFMTGTPIQDLLLQKACRNYLHYNSSICDHIDDVSGDYKKASEKVASVVVMLRAIVSLSPSAIIAIFIGPWCDKYGYKMPLLTANVGYMLSTLLMLVTVYHMELPLYVNIIASIPDGLSGGFITVFTAIYSQATVTTESKSRRLRFFALSLAMSITSPLAGFTGGRIYGAFGWAMVLYVSLAIAILAHLWAIFAIRDLVRAEHAQDGLREKIVNLFQLKNLSEGLMTCLKPRANRGRDQLWCCFGSICCIVFDIATLSISYLFVRQMYSWSVTYYTTVNSVSAIATTALNVPIIYLFTRVLKTSDPAMALVGSCFSVCQMIILGLAFKPWLYFLQCVVGVPVFLGHVGIRTHLSKLLEPDEVGKVFSFLASFDALLPVAGEVIYTGIFNFSIGFLPGLPYLVTAGISLISVGLLSFCVKMTRDSIAYQEMSKSEDGPPPVGNVSS